ncbi:hypothetical protein HaLaN_20544 [Haematococcus lacustris]|uniref:Uncharacterized protein n=1 Tax=Haematococcus lacustris TaxID=44745 RepID=A0A699ZPD0_HAELA|nr:hypothetical protein HaLaN_20544 [Haematococcus lacustris]
MAHAERVHRRHHQQGSAATTTPRGSTPETRRPGASATQAPVPASLTAEMEGLRPQQQWPRRSKDTRGPGSEDLEHFSRPGDRGGLAGVLTGSLAADSPTELW